MRPHHIFTASLVAFALGGCAGQAPWPISSLSSGAPDPEPTGSIASKPALAAPRAATLDYNDAYKLDSGDRLRIVVSGQDWLSNSYEVDASGAIEIPSHGKVVARGLNTVKLSAAIARRLKQDKLGDAHVAVQVETYRPFTIRGNVANPGQYPYVNNMTTETAIAIAGGLKSGTDKSAVSVSNGATGAARAPAVLSAPVRPGDTVTVTEER